MKIHLGEREISAVVAGLEIDSAAAKHLESCLSCRQSVSDMRQVIEARRRDLESAEPDWEWQRREILARLPSASTARPERRRLWNRPLLAAAAILVVAIALKVLWKPAPPTDPTVGTDFPVEQILADVDAILADDSIPGFEPIDPGLDDAIFKNGTS